MKIIQKAAIKAGNKYLIMRRSAKVDINPDCWDFPGGRLYDGEDPEPGLIRQVFEETGLKIKVLQRQTNYEIDTNDLPYHYVIYGAKILQGEDVVLSVEHDEYRWSTKEEMKTLSLNKFLVYYINDDSIIFNDDTGKTPPSNQ